MSRKDMKLLSGQFAVKSDQFAGAIVNRLVFYKCRVYVKIFIPLNK